MCGRNAHHISHPRLFPERVVVHPQDGVDPRQQDLHAERLGDVVVGAQGQSDHHVGLLALGGDQNVQRGAHAIAIGVIAIRGVVGLIGTRQVVHLAVSDGDDAAQAAARDVGQSPVDRGEQPGSSASGFRDRDGAQLEIRKLSRLLLDRGAG